MPFAFYIPSEPLDKPLKRIEFVPGTVQPLTVRDFSHEWGFNAAHFHDIGIGTFRYGSKLGDAHYRVYGKYSNYDDGPVPGGDDGADEWDVFQTGIQVDWDRSASDRFKFQGNVAKAALGEYATLYSLTPPYQLDATGQVDHRAMSVLGRWEHTFNEGSDAALQIHYDRYDHTELRYGEVLETFDVDFQHRFELDDAHELVWALAATCVSTCDSPGTSTNTRSGTWWAEISWIPNIPNTPVIFTRVLRPSGLCLPISLSDSRRDKQRT